MTEQIPSEYYESANSYTDDQINILNAHREGVEEVLRDFRTIRDFWSTWVLMSKQEQLEHINKIIHWHTL